MCETACLLLFTKDRVSLFFNLFILPNVNLCRCLPNGAFKIRNGLDNWNGPGITRTDLSFTYFF